MCRVRTVTCARDAYILTCCYMHLHSLTQQTDTGYARARDLHTGHGRPYVWQAVVCVCLGLLVGSPDAGPIASSRAWRELLPLGRHIASGLTQAHRGAASSSGGERRPCRFRLRTHTPRFYRIDYTRSSGYLWCMYCILLSIAYWLRCYSL